MVTKRASSKQPASVHQLKVTLLGLEPPIWRRIVVPSDFTLADLHVVVQEAMGWHHSHLHDFRVGKVLRFGGKRAQIALDLYNALNGNPVESYNQAFIAGGAWLVPTGILTARFAKLTAQFDF